MEKQEPTATCYETGRKTSTAKRATAITAALLGLVAGASHAQEKPDASVGIALVSNYIWRGQDQGNVSIQPEVSLAWHGLSLSAWGNVGFDKDDTKEIDLILGYETNGFSVSLTDYWTAGGIGFFHFGATNTAHVVEVQAGYDFGFLAANWYTNIAGNDGTDAEGNRAYSSYAALSAPFQLGGLQWKAEIGAVPWETDYYNGGTGGFAVSEISLEAAKDIPIGSAFSLPLFAKIAWNPATEAAFFTCGISF